MKQRSVSFTLIRRFNIIKMPILFKLICVLNNSKSNSQSVFSLEIYKLIQRKFYENVKAKNRDTIFKKNNKLGSLLLQDSKTYSKAIQYSIGTKLNKQNRLESPQTDPHTYNHLIFNKRGQHNLFNKWCWINQISILKNNNLDLYFTQIYKSILNESQT